MQTRDIKRRIRSVKSTQQITRAMKFVAAAKLRRAQDAMIKMRPYAKHLNAILRHMVDDILGDEHPLFRKVENPKRIATIIIAGDRGLCGGFNANILRALTAHVKSFPDAEHSFFCIGKRAVSGVRKFARNRIIRSYTDCFDKLSYMLSTELCDVALERMDPRHEASLDAVYLVYNEFVSAMAQRPTTRLLLPFDLSLIREERAKELQKEEEGKENEKGMYPLYTIEPDLESVLESLVSRRIATDVYQGMLESYAAELSARMAAMDSATNNADEIIGSLTLVYNRARQSGITSELIDIVGGANAQG